MHFHSVFLAMCAALVAHPSAASANETGRVKLAQMWDGYTYFNKAGSDFERHNSDLVDCLADMINLRSADSQLNEARDLGLVGDIVGGFYASSNNKSVIGSGIENCMIVRRWRLVALPQAEGESLAALDTPALTEKLRPWIGAADPHGEIVRKWANDAADPFHDRFSLRPDHDSFGQLSVKAATKQNLKQLTKWSSRTREANARTGAVTKRNKSWPKGAIKPETFAKAPTGSGIIIVHVGGLSYGNGNGFRLTRVNNPDSMLDPGIPQDISVFIGLIAAKGEGNFKAFAVPPGRWRIASMLGGILELNFCLGAPSFEVKAGEMVYTGLLDMSEKEMTPRLDLTGVRAWLGKAKVTATPRPAIYTNGSRDVCRPNAIYALEFAGVPFEAGYNMGGATQENR